MSTIEDGGPAFPVLADVRPSLDKEWCGMSLRDYFAAKSMHALLSLGVDYDTDGRTFMVASTEDAYKLADAMLAARKANPQK